MIVEEKFYIGYRDVDTHLKIKNSAILNLFEDIAGIHATKVGEGLKTSNTTWLLSAYKVNIIKRPEYGDNIKVLTWGTEIKNITASREFEIRNEKGELLITAISNWVHINLNSRKLEKVTLELIDKYKLEKTKTNFNELRLKRIDEPENYLYEKKYHVDWNWIDANLHMNNVYYLEVAEMTLPNNIREKNNYKGFEIMYKKEIKHDDIIRCLYLETEETYIVTIKSEDLSKLHAVVKLYKN